jgi:hypothetical protein
MTNLSRILNQRLDFKPMDYELLRWFLEKSNNKLLISETDTYKINGPPDIKKGQQTQLLIEDHESDGEEKIDLDDWERT